MTRLREGGVCLLTMAGVFFFWPSLRATADSPQQTAGEVLARAGVQGGLVVHLGCGDGRLTAALRADDRFIVHGLAVDTERVAQARKTIAELGLYGPVSVDRLTTNRLPYADNLAALVVVEEPGLVPMKEVLRVLAPGGVACVREGAGWKRTIKPRPKNIDDWTHYLHDASGNAVAADRVVGPPKRVRWIAGPLWGRSHEWNPSLCALVAGGGRLFYMMDDGLIGLPDTRLPSRWSLYARDAFSGTLLWKRPVPNWGWREWNTRGMWSAPLTLNRRLVTDGRQVFVTLGYKAPVSVLDAATGRTIRTLAGTDGTDELLLSDGVLFLLVRERLSVAQAPKKKPRRRRRLNPHEWSISAPGRGSVVAVDAATGQTVWRTEPQTVSVLTLAALNGRVCFYGEEGIVCLDAKTGKRLWATPCRPKRGSRHSAGTLVLYDDVVLFTSAEGLLALSAQTGEKLWTGPKVTGPAVTQPPDLFVADGLVWSGYVVGTYSREKTSVEREGRDPHTGEVKRKVKVPYLMSPLHHVRCYRSKATDRYLLLTKRGVEFLDLVNGDHMRNDWLRAMCHYGVMPCNGLLYVPPSYCFCYPGVRMNGFLALDAARPSGSGPASGETTARLERGPAYSQPAGNSRAPVSAPGDWPTYRHDPLRSGHTEVPVPADLHRAWQLDFQGKITQPVVVGDRLYVARVDAHQVVCLEAATGKRRWAFTAGARVDSPPTIHQGLILFGCRDGWVYCLRSADGALVWRFRAAPEERRIVAFEQLESPWPVAGSVLMLDGVAYAAAGRSSFLDGGIWLYGLRPQTGEVLYETRVEGPWPDVNKDPGRPFDMDGTKSDILVTDGHHIYMMQMVFDKKLRDVTPPRATSLGARITGRHLVATNGFLDDTWFDRIYWMYANRWPGFYFADKAPKAGQILVFDDQTTYGLHVFTERLRLSPTFTPGKGYELFADDNDNEPVLPGNTADREKGPGYQRAQPPKWSHRIPLRATAMVLAGDKLFLAGPPDVLPEKDPYAALEGRLGAELWVVSTSDGRKLATHELRTVPAFDGLIAARGRLYLSTRDGKLICFR